MFSELKAVMSRSWFPLATTIVGSYIMYVVLRKTYSYLHGSLDCREDETPYVEVLHQIVGDSGDRLYMPRPTQLLEFLYIGTDENARNTELLDSLGVTHVINTVDGHLGGSPLRLRLYDNRYKYLNFLAQDRRFYYILQHADDVISFIDDAHSNGGVVFIHCSLGVNRSAALAAVYIMRHKQQGPLTTAMQIKEQRGVTLTNPGFQEQLVHYANRHGLLARDRHWVENRSTEQLRASAEARAALEKKVQDKDSMIQGIFKDITS